MLETTFFPDGSFGEEGPRFQRFLNLGDGRGGTADDFANAWQALRDRVAGSGVSGPLDESDAQAGVGRSEGERLQRAVTLQCEQVERDSLHQAMAALPVADARRQAWFAPDTHVANALVAAWPTAAFEWDTRSMTLWLQRRLGPPRGSAGAALRPEVDAGGLDFLLQHARYRSSGGHDGGA